MELVSIQGAKADGYTVAIEEAGSNRYGARYFRVFLKDTEGQLGDPWALTGLFHSGSLPSYNWIEIVAFNAQISFVDRVITLSLRGVVRRLLSLLAGLIPAGGHFMVEYESPLWRASRAGLEAGWPPLLTPLGEVLWQVGCQGGFKDYYYAEGGAEGPRKLVAFKALDQEQAHQARQRLREEVEMFVSRGASPQQRAQKMLKRLSAEGGGKGNG